ncbi:unnamed protein product, partial [Staurois parvus]
MAVHSHLKQCAYSEAQTQHNVKQHKVNSLITPHVNPLLPNTISTVSVLFLTVITVLVSLGMSVTPSQFPPVSDAHRSPTI